ncbi:TPA: hypothetical protein ACKRC9_001769 [Proteus mirabilis]|uniref:hypothetical protein n=1 Tax=Proteus mirabilis TaxID=584 RepID=UPI0007CBDB35|nr:hypothetical protein [Proteus mirabilis]OAH95557.1 hypothetical protein AZH52_00435 [Proteus mirabilis]HDS4100007.1 hypothetical protein [Proteus mirabilis]HEJ9685459.1 hypothetical protein [Proteus mirabilis]
MIKLEQITCPDYLTSTKVKELTAEFINSNKKKSVWKNKNIINSLLESSHDKCAYCECDVSEESKYMEVEHFKCKILYPNEVVLWSNLLPSCKRCNGIKGDHDVCLNPIINPYIDEPNKHLKVRFARFRPIDDLGKETIDVLQLNDHQRLARKRAKLVIALDDKLDELKRKVVKFYHNPTDDREKRDILTKIYGILNECQPLEEYSGIMSTTLIHNSDFIEIKTILENTTLWNNELSNLYDKCVDIAFDICN